MRIWLYDIDTQVTVNESARPYLPCDVGKKVHIYEKLITGSYDYIVQDDLGSKFKVRETELDRLGDE
ncbi:YorP family protein [Niallia taxi]|uniref:YorP family protein n=1 Tax=Niallia taxi TaxID=2499688 RepID=UPI003181B371